MHLVGLGKPLEQKLILSNIKLDLFKGSHIFLTSFPFSSETHTMTGRAGLRMAPRAKSRLFNRSPQLGAYCQSGRGVGLELGLYLISSVLSPLSERQVLCSASDCSHSSAWHWGHTFWKRHPTQGLRAFKGGCISLWRGFSSFQIY